jgi:hypothetical protein
MVGEHLRIMAGAIKTGNDSSIRHMQEMVDVRLPSILSILSPVTCSFCTPFSPWVCELCPK